MGHGHAWNLLFSSVEMGMLHGLHIPTGMHGTAIMPPPRSGCLCPAVAPPQGHTMVTPGSHQGQQHHPETATIQFIHTQSILSYPVHTQNMPNASPRPDPGYSQHECTLAWDVLRPCLTWQHADWCADLAMSQIPRRSRRLTRSLMRSSSQSSEWYGLHVLHALHVLHVMVLHVAHMMVLHVVVLFWCEDPTHTDRDRNSGLIRRTIKTHHQNLSSLSSAEVINSRDHSHQQQP